MRIPWTCEEEHMLRQMIDWGYSPATCTEVLPCRTLASIQNKMQRMGLRVRQQKPQIDHERAAVLARAEKTRLPKPSRSRRSAVDRIIDWLKDWVRSDAEGAPVPGSCVGCREYHALYPDSLLCVSCDPRIKR